MTAHGTVHMRSPSRFRSALTVLFMASSCHRSTTTNGGASTASSSSVPQRAPRPAETVSPLTTGTAPDAAVAAAQARREFSSDELQSWCRKAGQAKTLGPSDGVERRSPLPSKHVCRNRFTYHLKSFTKAKSAEYGIGTYTVAIVHLADTGLTEEVHLFPIRVTGAWDEQSLDTFEVGDVDGDGTAEVFYAIYTHGEGTFSWKPKLLALHNDRLEPVKLPRGYQPVALKDVDHDGLWDVLNYGPYGGIEHDTAIGGDIPYFSGAGLFLLHSLGGFRFATDDVWTQKTARASCPSRILPRDRDASFDGPEPAGETSPDWRNPMQILCARVHGDTAQIVVDAISAQCTKFDLRPFGGDACFQSLLDIAKAEPPLRLKSVPPRDAGVPL